MATIQEARANAVLDKLMNYDVFGVITRREYVQKAIGRGYTVSVVMRPDRAAISNADRVLSSEVFGSRVQEAKAILENPPIVPEYRMNYPTGYWLEITKTEYDFALTIAPVATEAETTEATEATEAVPVQEEPERVKVALTFKSEAERIEFQKANTGKSVSMSFNMPSSTALELTVEGFRPAVCGALMINSFDFRAPVKVLHSPTDGIFCPKVQKAEKEYTEACGR